MQRGSNETQLSIHKHAQTLFAARSAGTHLSIHKHAHTALAAGLAQTRKRQGSRERKTGGSRWHSAETPAIYSTQCMHRVKRLPKQACPLGTRAVACKGLIDTVPCLNATQGCDAPCSNATALFKCDARPAQNCALFKCNPPVATQGLIGTAHCSDATQGCNTCPVQMQQPCSNATEGLIDTRYCALFKCNARPVEYCALLKCSARKQYLPCLNAKQGLFNTAPCSNATQGLIDTQYCALFKCNARPVEYCAVFKCITRKQYLPCLNAMQGLFNIALCSNATALLQRKACSKLRPVQMQPPCSNATALFKCDARPAQNCALFKCNRPVATQGLIDTAPCSDATQGCKIRPI